MMKTYTSILAVLLAGCHANKHERNLRRKGRYAAVVEGGIVPGPGCLEDNYGSSLGCTAKDIKIVAASDVTILDDGCQHPGDTVHFTATFQVESSANTRYDIGLWFGVDGDDNGDGALTGNCLVGTPFYDLDGDGCGDITTGHNPQYPQFEITTICKRSAEGWLILPYCSSWKQTNSVCASPSQALPATKSKCMCDPGFTVPSIVVPANDGGGSGVGDPHFETWYHRRYDFHGICDLVFLHSDAFMDQRGLDIHVRTSERDGTSFIATAVVQIGSDKLEVHEDGSYYWNEQEITDDSKLPEYFGDATMSHKIVDGYLPIWDIVRPSGGGRIYLQVFDTMVDVKLQGFNNEDVKDSVGLLGDFESGFLLDRSHRMVFDTDTFGHGWQVQPGTDPVLFREVREPQFPTQCSMPDPEAVKNRLENLWFTVEEAGKMCEGAGSLIEACITDLQLFGNPDVAKAYSFMDEMKHGGTAA